MKKLLLLLVLCSTISCTSIDDNDDPCFYEYQIRNVDFCYDIRGDRYL